MKKAGFFLHLFLVSYFVISQNSTTKYKEQNTWPHIYTTKVRNKNIWPQEF